MLRLGRNGNYDSKEGRHNNYCPSGAALVRQDTVLEGYLRPGDGLAEQPELS